MSDIVPPPFAMPTLPKKPLNVRIAIKVAMFGASALGICNAANAVKQTKYNFLRPNVSLSGARNNGPIPSMITNPVVHATTVSEVVSRDSAIWSIPGVNIDEAKGERMLMAAMTPTLISFFDRDHCRGFASSSSLKVMSSLLSPPSPPSTKLPRLRRGSRSPSRCWSLSWLSFAM
jgi:hypothetical protein